MASLKFEPTFVADAIRRIGLAGTFFYLTKYAKDPETIAALVGSATRTVDGILDSRLKKSVTNLFLDYVKIESNEDLAVVIYALEKNKAGSARAILRLFESRFCIEPCGIATLTLILGSKKDGGGNFIVDKKLFEIYSEPKVYSHTVQKSTVNNILKSLEADLDRLRVYLNPTITKFDIKYSLKEGR